MDKFIFLCLFLLPYLSGIAQEAPQSRCEIADEDVFIFFDEACLNQPVEACAALEDFHKYNLKNLIESGTYASWSMDGWKLEKTNTGQYRLHKKLTLFDQIISGSDKYKIDTRYWNTPTSVPVAKDKTGAINEPARVDKRGNVEFELKGFPLANRVVLSGSFNNWNEQSLWMVKLGDVWKLTMKMPPGIYEYKFIVDGEWHEDPENPFKVINPHNTFNSILIVGKEITFQLKGYTHAKRVSLSGSFNNWDEPGVPMTKTKDGWKVKQKLPPGKHFYKFIIDKKDWIIDPDNPLQERDFQGYINSVLVIF